MASNLRILQSAVYSTRRERLVKVTVNRVRVMAVTSQNDQDARNVTITIMMEMVLMPMTQSHRNLQVLMSLNPAITHSEHLIFAAHIDTAM